MSPARVDGSQTLLHASVTDKWHDARDVTLCHPIKPSLSKHDSFSFLSTPLTSRPPPSFEMGNDGGSIPDRRDLVRNKPKAEQADKANQTRARWFFCALSKVCVPSI
jgi:hypothetical protein